jgi:hypothetical protein
MQITHNRSTDNRLIVTARWERSTPDADAPMLEATFEVEFSDDFTKNDARFLVPLSVTRTDTRESVTLSEAEMREVRREVANHCADLTEDWD